MAEQEAVDALTAAVGQVSTDLASASATIQAELNTLKAEIAAGTPPNLEALTTAIDALDPAVQALGALKPA